MPGGAARARADPARRAGGPPREAARRRRPGARAAASRPIPDAGEMLAGTLASAAKVLTTPRLAPGPQPLPLVGNTADLLGNDERPFHEALLRYARHDFRGEPVVEVWLADSRVLIINDATLARELLFDRAPEFPDRPQQPAAQFFDEVDSAFVNTRGDNWKMYRSAANKSVSRSAALRRLAGTIADKTEGLVGAWAALGDGAVVRIDEASKAVTLEGIVSAIFSKDLGLIRGDPDAARLTAAFRNLLAASDEVQADVFQTYQFFETEARRKKERANAELDAFIVSLMEERAAMVAAGEPLPGDMLDSLVAQRDADGKPLRVKAITNTMTELLVAGHDTTASLISCTLMLLAYHPTVRARVVAELDEELPDGRPPRTLEHVEKLVFLNMVLKEVNRLYPGVAIVLRTSGEAGGQLGRLSIPPRTGLWTSPYVLGRMGEYWEDPDTFDPDRFAEDAGGAANPAYLPFGGGPRVCVGARLAMLEAATVVAGVLRAFDVSCAPELRSAISAAGGHLPVRYGAGLLSVEGALAHVCVRRRTVR